MITALIYVLRKSFRIGIPIESCALAVWLFGIYTHVQFFTYIAVGISCIYIAVMGITLSAIWGDPSEYRVRSQIREDVKEVKIYFKNKRIERQRQLTAGAGKAGNDDPTIYDHQNGEIVNDRR